MKRPFDLTGVTTGQLISVELESVNDRIATTDIVIPMGMLVGDTNGDGVVNSDDSLQTRNRSGQVTDGTNFRSDVNADGSINGGDTISVRAQSGAFLP